MKRIIQVKLKDINNNYILTLTDKDLKSKIYYSENINGPQGELSLTINNRFEELPVFVAEVYVITDANPLGRKIYSGILNKQTLVRTSYDEIRLSFVGIGSILTSYIYSKFTDSTGRSLDISKDQTIEDYVDDVLYNLKVSEWERIGETGTPVIDEVFTGNSSGATATLVSIESGGFQRAWFAPLTGYFDLGEVVTGGTSGATFELLNNNFLDIYKNLMSKGSVTGNSNTYNKQFTFLDQLTVLKDIGKLDSNLFFFIDQDGVLEFREKPTEALPQNTLVWDKDVLSVERNLDSDLINKVFLKIGTGEIIEEMDLTSVVNNGLHEKYIVDSSINDISSGTDKALSIIAENKDPSGELKIRINANYDFFVGGLTWGEMINTWGDYNQTWGSLGSFKSVYDFHPGDMINVRNFDEEKQLSNLLIVRKEFYEDYVILYCDKYKNYTESILENN